MDVILQCDTVSVLTRVCHLEEKTEQILYTGKHPNKRTQYVCEQEIPGEKRRRSVNYDKQAAGTDRWDLFVVPSVWNSAVQRDTG